MQLETMDLIALREAFPLPDTVCKRALRNLIRLGLVEVLSLSPGRYCLTPVGRMVRGRR